MADTPDDPNAVPPVVPPAEAPPQEEEIFESQLDSIKIKVRK